MRHRIPPIKYGLIPGAPDKRKQRADYLRFELRTTRKDIRAVEKQRARLDERHAALLRHASALLESISKVENAPEKPPKKVRNLPN